MRSMLLESAASFEILIKKRGVVSALCTSACSDARSLVQEFSGNAQPRHRLSQNNLTHNRLFNSDLRANWKWPAQIVKGALPFASLSSRSLFRCILGCPSQPVQHPLPRGGCVLIDRRGRRSRSRKHNRFSSIRIS